METGQHELLIAGARATPPPDPFTNDPVWIDRFETMLAATDPQRLARVFRGASTTDLPDRAAVGRIDVPALILAWTGDATHPIGTAEQLAELLPHGELDVARTRDDVEGWTTRIEDFLARVDALSG